MSYYYCYYIPLAGTSTSTVLVLVLLMMSEKSLLPAAAEKVKMVKPALL
jgi:hypothetical protein